MWLAAPLGFVAALGCCYLCLCLCCRRARLPAEAVQKGVASGGCRSRIDSTAGVDSFEQMQLFT